MYITDYIDNNGKCIDESIPKGLYMDGTTYVSYFGYWREKLFQTIMNLFKWSGLDDIFPQKEIELRLMLSGRAAICEVPGNFNAPFNSTITSMWCTMFGVTKYEDEFRYVNVRCPIWTGTKTIGKDVVVIDNNDLRTPLIHVVNHYAQLLAHNEVSIIWTFINARDAGGVPTASTEKQKQSLRTYYKNIYNGKFYTVSDVANLNVQFIGSDKRTSQNVKDLFETRSALLKAFYSDIGIRSAFEKNNNTVTTEVLADTSLLIFSLRDMLDARKRGAEEVNKMFNLNIDVEINDAINYAEMESGNDGNGYSKVRTILADSGAGE